MTAAGRYWVCWTETGLGYLSLAVAPHVGRVTAVERNPDAAAVNRKLLERGVPEEAIARVHTPIGTAIKAVTPEEIGISIAGELIYTRALRREAAGIVTTGCPMH